jgi:KDO2-lipid IV(A) lauroyltransferase
MRVTLQHRIEYALLMAVAAFLRALPLRVATGLTAFCWRQIAPLTHRHKRALDNLAVAMPHLSHGERQRIVRAMWDNLGRVMAETFVVDRLARDPTCVELEETYLIARYDRKMGRSVVASLHMGNWEMTAWPLLMIHAHGAAVYRVVENPLVDRFLRRQREHFWPGGLIDRGPGVGHAVIPNLLRHLQGNNELGMLTDLVDTKGIQVQFFGHTVWATPAAAWLARRTGARLWVARCIRVGRSSKFRVSARELHVPYSADVDSDVRLTTQAIYNAFEAWIREHPEQWMWSNKRWAEDVLEEKLKASVSSHEAEPLPKAQASPTSA